VYYPFKTLSQVRLKKKTKKEKEKNCEIKQSVSKMRKTDMHTHTQHVPNRCPPPNLWENLGWSDRK